MNTIHQAVYHAFSEIASRHPRLSLPSTITDVAIHEFTQALFENGEEDPVTQEDANTLTRLKEKIALAEKERLTRGAAGPAINQLQNDIEGLVGRLETFLRSPQLNVPTEDPGLTHRLTPSSLEDLEEADVGLLYNELPDEMQQTVLDSTPVRDLGKYALVNKQARTQVNEKLKSVLQLVVNRLEKETSTQDEKEEITQWREADFQELQAILATEEALEMAKKGSTIQAFLKRVFDVIRLPKGLTVCELPDLIVAMYKNAYGHGMSLTSYLTAIQEIKEKGTKASTFQLLNDDKWAMTFALMKDGLALKSVSDELKADAEMVKLAVEQNGLALKFASDKLKADLEIVASAVAQNYKAHKIVDPSLKFDEKVLRALASHVDMAVLYEMPPGEIRDKVLRWIVENRNNRQSSQ